MLLFDFSRQMCLFDLFVLLWFTFIVNLCRFFFWFLKTGSDKLQNVCLSSVIVVVIICVLVPAYTSLCRGLKYSSKVRYITAVDLLRDVSLIFKTVFLSRSAKIISQKWATFAFGNTCLHQTFTECMFNQ